MVAAGVSPQSATPSQRREWRLKDQHGDVTGSLSELESPEKVSAKRTSETKVEELITAAKKARPAESPEAPEAKIPAKRTSDSPDAPEAKIAGADSPDERTTNAVDVFDQIEAAAGSQQPAGANSPVAVADPLLAQASEQLRIQKRSGVVIEQCTGGAGNRKKLLPHRYRKLVGRWKRR